jgi:hypothetical protein
VHGNAYPVHQNHFLGHANEFNFIGNNAAHLGHMAHSMPSHYNQNVYNSIPNPYHHQPQHQYNGNTHTAMNMNPNMYHNSTVTPMSINLTPTLKSPPQTYLNLQASDLKTKP